MLFFQRNRAMSAALQRLLLICCLLWCSGIMLAQSVQQYHIDISLPKGGHLSGICLIRMDSVTGDGAMSVVNEFGIKAYDAVYSGKKHNVKLKNTMPVLNKWYIRRVIAKDMSVLFNPNRKLPGRRVLLRKDDGSLLLSNKRFKITYSLRPITANVTE